MDIGLSFSLSRSKSRISQCYFLLKLLKFPPNVDDLLIQNKLNKIIVYKNIPGVEFGDRQERPFPSWDTTENGSCCVFCFLSEIFTKKSDSARNSIIQWNSIIQLFNYPRNSISFCNLRIPKILSFIKKKRAYNLLLFLLPSERQRGKEIGRRHMWYLLNITGECVFCICFFEISFPFAVTYRKRQRNKSL